MMLGKNSRSGRKEGVLRVPSVVVCCTSRRRSSSCFWEAICCSLWITTNEDGRRYSGRCILLDPRGGDFHLQPHRWRRLPDSSSCLSSGWNRAFLSHLVGSVIMNDVYQSSNSSPLYCTLPGPFCRVPPVHGLFEVFAIQSLTWRWCFFYRCGYQLPPLSPRLGMVHGQ